MNIEKIQTYSIPKEFHDKTIAAFLKHSLKGISWAESRAFIKAGQVKLGKRTILDSAFRLKADQEVTVSPEKQTGSRKTNVFKEPKIIYLDEDIVVVDKPEGLTTIRHPFELEDYGDRSKYLPRTLTQILPKLVSKKGGRKKRKGTPPPLKAVHRLDKETSGLLVFARNSKAASHLGKQFKEHTVRRKYLAIVCGEIFSGRLETLLARDRGDGMRGSHPKVGKTAITHVKLLEVFGNYSLAECRLETGRTHQIRIHLAEMGHPICGEKVYIKRFKRKKLLDKSGAKRLTLHATTLGFQHPKTGKFLEFESPLPKELNQFIKNIGRS